MTAGPIPLAAVLAVLVPSGAALAVLAVLAVRWAWGRRE